MKLTIKQLLELADNVEPNGNIRMGSLSKLLTKELPVKTAYTLGKLFNKVKSELQQYYLHRDNLIKKYGREKDGATTIQADDKEAMEKFVKDNDELLSVEVDINYEPIPITALDNMHISPIDMGNLDMLFKEI